LHSAKTNLRELIVSHVFKRLSINKDQKISGYDIQERGS
jgi:hypothetical protein